MEPVEDSFEDGGILEIPSFALAQGGRLTPLRLAWRSWGRLNKGGDNAVLLFHPFGGDRHAAGLRPSGRPGWWSELVGVGGALDTRRYWVVCADVPGGTGESSGPATLGPNGKPFGGEFPELEVADWIRAFGVLLDMKGVSRLEAVCGCSMGGLQALQWLAIRGESTRRALVVAMTPRLEGHAQAYCSHILSLLELGRRGAELAGGFCQMTSHSDAHLTRAALNRGGMDELMREAGKAFATDDPVGFRRLVTAMRRFDLGRGEALRGNLAGFRGRAVLASFKEDWLFPHSGVREVAEALRASGAEVNTRILDGEDGHISFLTRPKVLAPLFRELFA